MDTNSNNENHSWCFGDDIFECCRDFSVKAKNAKKPIDRPSDFLDDHRAVGFRNMSGELMIFLEIREYE